MRDRSSFWEEVGVEYGHQGLSTAGCGNRELQCVFSWEGHIFGHEVHIDQSVFTSRYKAYTTCSGLLVVDKDSC